MTTYAIKNPAGVVVGLVYSDDAPEIVGENIAVALAIPIQHFPDKPFQGAVPTCPVDAIVWRDDRAIANSIAIAYAKCFTDINAIVWDAVGNMTEEYKDAEIEARTFKAGGYLGTAPEMVACYASKESQTATWATDDILARADAFNAAKKAMRSQRMARQKEMQEATTLAQLDAVVAAWDGFITQLRTQLGL